MQKDILYIFTNQINSLKKNPESTKANSYT